jgi:transposase
MFRREVRAAHHFVAWLALLGPDQGEQHPAKGRRWRSRGHALPEAAGDCVAALGAQLRMLKAQILEFDRRIMTWHRSNETSKRLERGNPCTTPQAVQTKWLARRLGLGRFCLPPMPRIHRA